MIIDHDRGIASFPRTDAALPPILICLLGPFRLLKNGHPVAVRSNSKTEGLLCHLGLAAGHPVPRETLLVALWPSSPSRLASQSLHSLLHSLQKLLSDATDGAPPVVHTDGNYQLNVEAGLGIDVTSFDALATAGDQQRRAGDLASSAISYRQAVALYRGDLCVHGSNFHTAVEREHLRARYLSLLAQLANYHFTQRDYSACLDAAQRLLTIDPCREDGHRLVMRCYVRQEERGAALRQYRLCVDILRSEFDAAPELATMGLFDQVRLDPSSI